jgi:hypothetical protein
MANRAPWRQKRLATEKRTDILTDILTRFSH